MSLDSNWLCYSPNPLFGGKSSVGLSKQISILSSNFRSPTVLRSSDSSHKKASGHCKVYINPCLTSTNSSNLEFSIGLLCTTAVCKADDMDVLYDYPRKLQGAINIVGHYGRRYWLIFGADKIHDMQYYKDSYLWSLYGSRQASTNWIHAWEQKLDCIMCLTTEWNSEFTDIGQWY